MRKELEELGYTETMRTADSLSKPDFLAEEELEIHGPTKCTARRNPNCNHTFPNRCSKTDCRIDTMIPFGSFWKGLYRILCFKRFMSGYTYTLGVEDLHPTDFILPFARDIPENTNAEDAEVWTGL